MKKIDMFLEFLLEQIGDTRLSIFKKIKYGHRYYYISFLIDEEPNLKKNSPFQFRENLEIIFDNRNNCIEIHGGEYNNALIIEDTCLLKKWSEILETIVSDQLEDKVITLFEKSLNDCYNKNIYRELQMKKIFKEDDTL